MRKLSDCRVLLVDDAKANLDILVREIAEAPSVRNSAQAGENPRKNSVLN